MYSKQFRVAKFTRMDEGDADDYALEREAFENSTTVRDLPIRLLDHLKLLAGHTYGHHIDRLTHCLQAATRAQEDGRDDQYVAMALLHDIGDVLSPLGHEEIAAGILAPYVREELLWIVRHHAIFQGWYYWHLDGTGRDRNARDKFRNHPHFAATAEFCEKYDQISFDPFYRSLPLEAFEETLKRVFSVPVTY
jgi:predicted HD phosphohydrolase